MNIGDYGFESDEMLYRHMYEFATGIAGAVRDDSRKLQNNAICIAFDVDIGAVTYGYAGQLSKDFNMDLLLNFADFVEMSEDDVKVKQRNQRPYCQCAEAHAVAKMTQEIRRRSVTTGIRTGHWVNSQDTGLCPAGWWSEDGEIWNAWEVLRHTVLMAIREPSKESGPPSLKDPCGNCLTWIRAGNIGGYFNAAGRLVITAPTPT